MDYIYKYPVKDLILFAKESNSIERIFRAPTEIELRVLDQFLQIPKLEIDDLVYFVDNYQPGAKLRTQYGDNVRIGKYYPPFGAPDIYKLLKVIFDNIDYEDAWTIHCKYEKLHPFMDGNGRSGRALWAWKHKDISQGFLVPFYYQTLQHYEK